MNEHAQESLLALTAEIVTAHTSHNNVGVADLPDLIARVHGALAGLGVNAAPAPALTPAVSIRASVTRDYIVCLEDGKKFHTLKRHLASDHDLTPDAYRAKWGLARDYPMTSRSYSERRTAISKELALGRKSKGAA